MSVLDAAARVIEHHQAEEVDGVLLDAQTARAIMAVAQNLSPENRAKFDAMPIAKAGKIAWKMVS